MKLRELYRDIVKYGLKKDPRTKREIDEDIKRVRKEYNGLKGIEKKLFDRERLEHPYSDTRILYGDHDADIRSILVGIDMEAPELLLADRLKETGTPVDLVMAHHPEGRALSNLSEVMHIHKGMLSKQGIKPEIAAEIMNERIDEVARSISAVNHARSVDAARLLDIPYMCVHTAADNHVAMYLQEKFDGRKPAKVRDVLGILKSIPEYRAGIGMSSGPKLIAGKPGNKAGKVVVDMTGGTEGSKRVFARLSQAGVGTLVLMHLSEGHFKNAKIEHINLVIAGHISSDTLGLNLLFDNIEKKEKLNIIGCSGFKRIRRN
ncbi:MAG: NGG1p interacting factor NIF3 [Candidatus Omnitrophota bacterium]